MSAILSDFPRRWFANDNVLFCAAKFTVESDWLNGVTLAEYLHVAPMTLHRWRFGYTDPKGRWHEPVANFPKPYRFGGPKSPPVWKKTDIDAWREEQRSDVA